MAVTVQHLNADTTFLLSFSPTFAPRHAAANFPGSFKVLIDPWLSGHSSIWNPQFQISHHTTAPCITSLADMPLPDLIVISQDKPDHCHRETLCTLPADTRIRILATPAAAKKIRSWKHFKNATIESLAPFNADKKNDHLVRIPIPSFSSKSAPGEITIAYMPQRMDITALHNAIGITYRSPGVTTTTPWGDVTNLPVSPPETPPSPSHSFGPFPSEGTKEKTLSVLYSPHGVSYPTVAPYARTHLARESALPLTALFHSINVEENPWFMGGMVAAGFPGGEQIVRELGARYWISAHDEVKDNRGWSVAWIKSTAFSRDDAQKKLD
ncbi:hypothetical protein BDV97DRAFT_275669, partial [Delphinella strobiligena]